MVTSRVIRREEEGRNAEVREGGDEGESGKGGMRGEGAPSRGYGN